jgi:secreted PhoX family phosphatase
MSHLLDDDGISNSSGNQHLTEVIEKAIARNPGRRGFIKSSAALGALTVLGSTLSACGSDAAGSASTTSTPVAGAITFKSVATSTGDTVVVPEGYDVTVLLRWGDPVLPGAPAFKGDASEGWQEQEEQAGDNHDGIFFFPFKDASGKDRSDAGLLAINHEYINPEYLFKVDGNNWYDTSWSGVRKMLAAHGVSIVEVKRSGSTWAYVKDSIYNRRITGYTPIEITGPARGHALLQTVADPSGTEVLGTLNNCGSGKTPWGTYLTCEENFNGYFGTDDAGWAASAHENRYGLSKAGFGYGWHKGDPRFDLKATPNEPNRFGWVVEIDPYSPASQPKKRTALGRFKHEGAECVLSTQKKAVVYSGCDERNEYLYKFVSTAAYDAANPASGRSLLDSGTLYVARFDAGATAGDQKGTGVWIPLIHGQNGLTPENGFANQAEVLIKSRQASDRVGATMMDRPEWVAANPTKAGEVYLACTNNNRRGTTAASANAVDGTTVAGSARPALDEANPRAVNNWGHIIRWNEKNGDAAAAEFDWDIFVIAGNPTLTGDKKGSAEINANNLFNSPDGLQFDPEGRLWIQTDGSYANTGDFAGMGNNQMLVADTKTKAITRFLVGPAGCEVTGVCWTPDGKTAFVDIQHPGEIGSHPNAPAAYKAIPSTDANAQSLWVAQNPTAFSKWPDGASAGRPRSATIVITKRDGGVIGS